MERLERFYRIQQLPDLAFGGEARALIALQRGFDPGLPVSRPIPP